MIRETYDDIRARLKQAGIDQPDLESRWILKSVLKITDADLITGAREVTVAEQGQIDEIAARRLAGEPISRIFGQREFWGLNFTLGPDTLDPRPDTERLVEIAVEHLKKKFHVKQKTAEIPAKILDLGTGTGCILISLLREFPQATGIATDLSTGALEVSLHNASALGVGERFEVFPGDWADALPPEYHCNQPGKEGHFDLVVSNPPYIAQAEIPNLDTEVRNHDPILALDGGEDGLQAYKKIFSSLPGLLKTDGIALLEIGFDQEHAIARLAEKYRIRVKAVHRDHSNRPRVAEITRGDK